ncbi:MAG TPA: biotin-dependent carboxyltransferase family protein [Actinocatenispora sp.]
MRALTVLRPGLLTTVQDRGRVGLAYLGVPRSGAADLPALALANRLVGNDEAAAGLELTLTGATFRAEAALMIAVTGAPAPVRVDGRGADVGLPLAVPAGAEVSVGPARAGLRTYLAVDGGVTVPPVLGSRSTDTLSGLGPAPLRRGDTVPVGEPYGVLAAVDVAPADDPGPVTLRVHPGPRAGWFTADAVGTLLSASYAVSPTSNRVGARLTGPPLARAVDAELPSEGVVLGAVQVPADGQPLVFLADHPTTGGYPVIAVLDPADVPRAAQARPGTPVRFVPATGIDVNSDPGGLAGWT